MDTNVLLAATDRGRATWVAACRVLEGDPRALAVTPQIVREYLAVATRPVALNGLGLDGTAAEANVGDLLEGLDLLREDAETVRILRDLVRRGLAMGKQVHDANVVAAALRWDASAIVTDNEQHFRRFASLVPIETLSPGATESDL
ncbi:type II toxin-antitoxin system VapC family toxin [Salana multivorans]